MMCTVCGCSEGEQRIEGHDPAHHVHTHDGVRMRRAVTVVRHAVVRVHVMRMIVMRVIMPLDSLLALAAATYRAHHSTSRDLSIMSSPPVTCS